MASRLQLLSASPSTVEEVPKCQLSSALLPTKEYFSGMGMEEIYQLSLLEDGNKTSCIVVEINRQATVQNLISAYCTQRGIPSNPQLVVYDTGRKSLSPYATLHSLGVQDKQTLFVACEKKSSIRDRKWLLVLVIVLFALGLIGILAMSIAYAQSGGVIPFDHGVVLDAGSTKTKILLYRWAGNKYKGTGCVKQDDSCRAKGKGIARESNVSYVLPCIYEISEKIPDKLIPNTPIYFAATGGMRLLNISNPNKANSILESLHSVLNSTGLELRAVDIITGQDEGFYGWITTNFLKDTLPKTQATNPWQPSTYGALDMGGASMQISFAVDPTAEWNDEIENVTLYGQKHHVFSISDLCFGRDEAERRHRLLLMQNPESKTEFEDPCLPEGYLLNLPGRYFFEEPCTVSKTVKNWLQKFPQILDKTFHFTGTSDFKKCSEQMKDMTNTKQCQNHGFSHCFQKLDRSWDEQRFVAFSSYFFTTDYLSAKHTTLPGYINITDTYCTKKYTELNINDTFATSYCFNGCYIYEVLINGYGFNITTWKNLEFLSEIDEKDLGWTLGYMINATNAITEKIPSEKFTTEGTLAVCLFLFTITVIVTFTFLTSNYCGKRRTVQGSHQALFRNP